MPGREGLGCWSEILNGTPKKYEDPVLWPWLGISFTPMRLQF